MQNIMLHARYLRLGDRITAQLEDGFHDGTIIDHPLPAQQEVGVPEIVFTIQCTPDGKAHGVRLPSYRLTQTWRQA